MRFRALEVENMFAYNGPSRLDLSGSTPERNIIVITGRNGAGKTSLLNAIKLLFLGPTDERLRRVGFGGTMISAKQYVLGQPGRWYGVFNNASGIPVARVSLEWSEDGREYRARRTFRSARGGQEYTEELEVTLDGVPLSQADAEATLNQLLPKEVVPFFFFDGEQIQSLADAEIGREQVEIERLLGLSFVVQLITQIDGFAKEKARAGLPQDIQVRITSAENAARDARSRAEAHGRSRVQLEDERIDRERDRRKIDDERNRLRGGALSDSERRRIEGRIAVLEYQREDLASRIAEALPLEAPFLTDRQLVEQAFGLLDGHVGGATDNTQAARLHRELPEDVERGLAGLAPPVEIGDEQREALATVVREALERHGVKGNAPTHPLLRSLSERRAARLRDQFLVWKERGSVTLASQQADLRTMRQITSELARIRRELDEAELTSDEAKANYGRLSDELEKIDADIKAAIERSAELRVEEQRALRDTANEERKVSELEAEYRDVARENRAYQLANRTKRALERYRDLRRAQIRASVETRLNERVAMLLGPSELIKRVSLDEHFVMSYFDERGNAVARHSISAGMRQLLAMAMVWALKDEAERPLPVIVDTPLGRIDRTNRGLLMDEYFPNAGNPLVLLPTDTEFGADGFDRIGDRVCRRYRIENSGGDSARIVPEPMGTGAAS